MINYVVSYDLAVKLKGLGMKTDTQFCYVPDNMYHKNQTNLKFHPRDDVRLKDDCYPAPITDELSKLLPDTIGYHRLIVIKDGDKYEVQYINEIGYMLSNLEIEPQKKQCDALALVLIKLIEQGHVKL